MPFDDIGFDPDKDYLFDPQMKEEKFTRCDCCGHQIFRGEVYYALPVSCFLSGIIGNDYLTICADCRREIRENIL